MPKFIHTAWDADIRWAHLPMFDQYLPNDVPVQMSLHGVIVPSSTTSSNISFHLPTTVCVEKHPKEFLGGSELAPISATALPPTEIQQCECSNVARYLGESTVPSWFIVYPSSYKAKCLVCLSVPLYIYVDLFICTYNSPGKATSPHYCNGSEVGTTSPSQEMFIEVGLGYHSLTR